MKSQSHSAITTRKKQASNSISAMQGKKRYLITAIAINSAKSSLNASNHHSSSFPRRPIHIIRWNSSIYHVAISVAQLDWSFSTCIPRTHSLYIRTIKEGLAHLYRPNREPIAVVHHRVAAALQQHKKKTKLTRSCTATRALHATISLSPRSCCKNGAESLEFRAPVAQALLWFMLIYTARRISHAVASAP